MNLSVYVNLLVVFASFLGVSSSQPSSSAPERDMAFLGTFLESKYPELSSEELKQARIEILSFPEPVLQYTSTSKSLLINPPSSEYQIKSICLESQDFLIADQPLLKHDYNESIRLEVVFRPLSSGTKADFLIILTSYSIQIFYIQGHCLDLGYELSPIYLEHEKSAYGVSEICIRNPTSTTINKISVKSGNKSLSIEKTKNILNPLEFSEIAVVRSYFTAIGDYKTYIELLLGNTLFTLPVHIKVFLPRIEIPAKIDFGLVASKNKVLIEPLFVNNYASQSIKVTSISSLSKNFIVLFNPKNVPGNSKNFQVCQIKFTGKNEGKFIGKVEITTAQQVLTIECSAFVSFGFVYIPYTPFVYNPLSEVIYSFDLQNKLDLDLVLKDLNFESTEVKITESAKGFQLTANIQKSGLYWASVSSILGKVYFNVDFTDPKIELFRKVDNSLIEINQIVNIGPLGYNSKHVEVFVISNSNSIPIVVNEIIGKNDLKIIFQSPNSELSELSSTEFYLELTALNNRDEIIEIKTSVGVYFIHFAAEVVSGLSKVRSIYFSNLLPGQVSSQYMYIFNMYPVPITIHSIENNNKGVSVDVTLNTIQPQKEQAFGIVQYIAPMVNRLSIDWSKSVTFSEVRVWNDLQNTCGGYQKMFDLIADIDVSGKIQVPLLVSFQRPSLSVRILSLHGQCMVYDTCLYYVSVQNPLNYPITMQLLASPENLIEELHDYDCTDEPSDQKDDEFENYINTMEKNLKKKQCLSMGSEELLSIKFANTNKPLNTQSPKNIFEKIQLFFSNLLNQCEKDQPDTPLPYFTNKKVEIVEQNSSKVLGPIYYTPTSIGSKDLPFILRNNFTVLENFFIPVRSLGPKLSILKRNTYLFTGKNYTFQKSSLKKEQIKLLFEISPEEAQSFIISSDSYYSPIFIRTFELYNLGSADAEIEEFSFENGQCEQFGLSVTNCKKSFVLRPSEMVLLQFNYMPGVFAYTQGMELRIKSNFGIFRYQVDIKLPELGVSQYFILFGEELMVICLGFVFAVFTWQVKVHYIRVKKVKGYSSKDSLAILVGKVFVRQFAEPIFKRIDTGFKIQGGDLENAKVKIEEAKVKYVETSVNNEENIVKKTEIVLKKEENSVKTEESLVKSIQKAAKIEENLVKFTDKGFKASENILKSEQFFEPKENSLEIPNIRISNSNSDYLVNSDNTIPVTNSLPKIKNSIPVASDPILLLKPRSKPKYRSNLSTLTQEAKPKKHSAPIPEIIANNKLLLMKGKRALSDEPAPKPQETIKESDSDDDFYIDSYKTHNVLFGGVSPYKSSLAELTEDSDPIV